MKPSEMTNEELAARLEVHAVSVMGCVGSSKTGREIAGDIRDAAVRLRAAIAFEVAHKTAIDALGVKVAELRECIKKAIMKECSLLVNCADCRARDCCDMRRWRKALEGADNGK